MYMYPIMCLKRQKEDADYTGVSCRAENCLHSSVILYDLSSNVMPSSAASSDYY